ncbi:MAG: hypothetical protein AAFQ50_10910, partial [Pseudomonadota bacterium]
MVTACPNPKQPPLTFGDLQAYAAEKKSHFEILINEDREDLENDASQASASMSPFVVAGALKDVARLKREISVLQNDAQDTYRDHSAPILFFAAYLFNLRELREPHNGTNPLENANAILATLAVGRRDQAQVLYEQCLQLLDRRAFKAQEIHVEELAFKAAHPDGYVEIIPQRLFNFALELMGASSGTPRLDWEEDFTLPPDADYIALARLVTTDDPDAAARAVCRLCDLHVTYSRPFGPDNEDALTGFEFDDPFLALWPVEV